MNNVFYGKQVWNRKEIIYHKSNSRTSMYNNYFY